jgi:hypothetical protein
MNIFSRWFFNKKLNAIIKEAKFVYDELEKINNSYGAGKQKGFDQALELHNILRLEVEERAIPLYTQVGLEVHFKDNHHWVVDRRGHRLPVLYAGAFKILRDSL